MYKFLKTLEVIASAYKTEGSGFESCRPLLQTGASPTRSLRLQQLQHWHRGLPDFFLTKHFAICLVVRLGANPTIVRYVQRHEKPSAF
jgi:hypothetical protein